MAGKRKDSSMREIKFRGKNNDVWYFGNLHIVKHKEYDAAYIVKNKPERPLAIPVVLETIGQFTGLQDSKGNDIYEGDILCIKQHELDILRGAFRETEIICVVEFRNGAFIPVMSDGKGYCWINFIYDKMPTADYTVIGNIHDNPELMEANQ